MGEKIAALKPYLIAAAIGFLLSLILVITGDGGLSAILYKPLLSALIWGGLAFGVRQLLGMLVPDLEKAIWPSEKEADSAGGAEDAAAAGSGKGLNLNLSTGDDADASGAGFPASLDQGSSAPATPRGPGLFGNTPVISETWVKPAEAPKSALPPRKPDASSQFDQDEKVLAKAVRSVMNQ